MFIERVMGCKFLRYNPNAPDFDLFGVIFKMYADSITDAF